LKFFVQGSPTEFNGGRKADEIVDWLIKKSGPAVVEDLDKEILLKTTADNKVVALCVGEKDSVNCKAFAETA